MVYLSSRNILYTCAFAAALTELAFIALTHSKFSFHLSDSTPVVSEPVQTELITLTEEAPKLISANAHPSTPEQTISTRPLKQSNPSLPTQPKADVPPSNQVQQGKPLSPSHGPILIESPSPVIPEYLKTQDINAKVVIEFTVLSNGSVIPKLLTSSRNEELDQIAIATARRWKFFPAESDHHPVDSKVKLRILFEVK